MLMDFLWYDEIVIISSIWNDKFFLMISFNKIFKNFHIFKMIYPKIMW